MRQLVFAAAVLASLAARAHGQVGDAEADLKAGRYAEARAKLAPAAQRGDAAAQYLLSSTYLNGTGALKNTDEAIRWLKKAAAQGYARAQADLGAMYLVGRYVSRDPEHGAQLLRAAAEQGDANGYYNLGVMYRDGLGVDRDLSAAQRYFEKSAAVGYSLAQYALARLAYEAGSFADAAHWYGKAADQGDLEAMYNLGYMHYYAQGVPQDHVRATKLFLRVAEAARYDEERRGTKAMDMLGNAYRDGKGVPQDDVEAYKWYLLAAAQGHPSAPGQLEAVARRLTPARIKEARDRADAFAHAGTP